MANYCYKSKIVSLDELILIVNNAKAVDKKVVFTNGCFDILHKGHVHYLRDSRKLGNLLIVALNSDKSVRRLKGNSRPINSEQDRAYVLEALEFVDYVVIFHNDTPLDLICKLRPDYYTKSGDYSMENVIGAGLGSDIVEQYGGKVILMDYIEGYSTTTIISK